MSTATKATADSHSGTDTTKTAAIYVRRSRVVAGDNSTSAEAQEQACRAWCGTNGYEVTAVYADLNVSGGKDDRPELNRLRADLRRYDAVVAVKIDRWARSTRDFSQWAETCQSAGVALVAVKDQLDMSTPVGRFIATIIAALAEMELAMITERLQSGKDASKAVGRWQGGSAPYGFDIVPNPDKAAGGNVLRVNDTEAAIIRESIAKRAAGASWRELTAWFNANVPSRRGGAWTRLGVRKVLTNERLSGTVLTASEYEAALEVCAAQESHGHSTAPSRLLSGVVKCAGCGTKMIFQRDTRPGKSSQYVCQGHGCTARARVSADKLDELVSDEYLAAYAGRQETRVVPQADKDAERRAELQAAIRKLSASLGELTDDELPAAIRERAKMRAELDKLAARRRGVFVVVNTGRTLGAAWEAAGLDERRRMIQGALDGAALTVRRRTNQLETLAERLPGDLFRDV